MHTTKTMAMASSMYFALVTLVLISLQQTPIFATKKTYIVYLGSHQHGPNPTQHDTELAEQSHYELMESVLGSSEKARESILYNYNNVINGFAASLTEEEAGKLKGNPNVVSVFESRVYNIGERPSHSAEYSLGVEGPMNRRERPPNSDEYSLEMERRAINIPGRAHLHGCYSVTV